MRFAHDNIFFIVRKLLCHAKIYMVANFKVFAVRASSDNYTCLLLLCRQKRNQTLLFNIRLNQHAILKRF